MSDFPPAVSEFGGPGRVRTSRDLFAGPDTRSPGRFLVWLMRQQWRLLLLSCGLSLMEWVPAAVGPYLVGSIIDQGVVPGDAGAVLRRLLLLLAIVLVGIVAGVGYHTVVVRCWLVGMYGPMKLVTRKSTQLGHVLPRRTPTGEVLSVSSSDCNEFGGLTQILSEAAGALAATVLIAGLVLSTSPRLGLVVLVGAPLIVAVVTPLLAPLQRREEVERQRSSELTSMATDIVAGLRILRGIGGEQTFARNYDAQSRRTQHAGVAAGVWQAAVDSAGLLLAGLFLALLTWLGARELLQGRLRVGELVSFFGYAVFLVWPIQTFFTLAQKWIRGLVSARKAATLLAEEPPWTSPVEALRLPVDAELRDQASGFVARPGRLTALVSALPDDSRALADRLGRYLPIDSTPPGLDVEPALRGRAARRARHRQREQRRARAEADRERVAGAWGVTLGQVDLGAVPIADVRRAVLVSDTAAQVFAGSLQAAIDPLGRLTRTHAERALHAAAAKDVFDALPGGWQGTIDERGRGLSGGQRQRVVLARALAFDPEVLVLVEPTSAVDAHTEATIAERLADFRRGRTTVVVTASPVLLHHADEVAFLDGPAVVATGPHAQLLRECAGYRAVVTRGTEAGR